MKIALITDTHLAGFTGAFNANCEAAITWIDGLGADLAIHLGDITADGVNDADQFAAARQILARMRTPLRLIPGNHDIGDSPIPGHRSAEPPVQADRLALCREVFGPDYWAHEGSGWMLVGLNAQLFGMGGGEEQAQFAWLEKTLAGVSTSIGVMLHKPLFRFGPDDTEIHHRYVQLVSRKRLLKLLEGRDLRFVASGHTHQLRRLHVGGVEHVWAPSSAYFFPDVMQERIGEKMVGVMVLTLDASGHSFAFHAPPGVVPYDLTDFADLFPKLRRLLAKASAAGSD